MKQLYWQPKLGYYVRIDSAFIIQGELEWDGARLVAYDNAIGMKNYDVDWDNLMEKTREFGESSYLPISHLTGGSSKPW